MTITSSAPVVELPAEPRFASWPVSTRLLFWIGALFIPIAWQIYATVNASPLIPGPIDLVPAFGRMIASGELLKACIESALVFFGGVSAGVLVGGALGLLMGRFRIVDAVLEPYVSGFYATPKIALIPILVVVLGWGFTAKIVIVAMVVFTPVCFNTATGLRGISGDVQELATSFCSSEYRRWIDVLLPGALPAVIPGLYIGAGRALTAVVVAEFSTKVTGLGNLIQTYSTILEMSMSLVPVVVLILAGYGLYALLKSVERHWLHWAVR